MILNLGRSWKIGLCLVVVIFLFYIMRSLINYYYSFYSEKLESIQVEGVMCSHKGGHQYGQGFVQFFKYMDRCFVQYFILFGIAYCSNCEIRDNLQIRRYVARSGSRSADSQKLYDLVEFTQHERLIIVGNKEYTRRVLNIMAIMMFTVAMCDWVRSDLAALKISTSKV